MAPPLSVIKIVKHCGVGGGGALIRARKNPDHATMHMKLLPMFTYNLWMGCLEPDTKSIILSSYQHCDEQQFQTLSCAFYINFPVLNLYLVIHALLLDYILAEQKKNPRTPCVHLVFI